MKSTKAFTLIETLIAMAIGAISVAAIAYSYIYFNNTYQNILDKANMSQSGRFSLHQISKDLRNAGFKDVHYTKKNWDRWIEKKENYNNTGGDYLRIWYNTSSQDRLEVRYYLTKDASTQETSLVREMIENPETLLLFVFWCIVPSSITARNGKRWWRLRPATTSSNTLPPCCNLI